ncbi:MAG: hypothetical protein FWC21_06470 [Treponema sp.]|nr:hypothetical protein [Treponema sp.]
MKKIFILLLICLISIPCVYGKDRWSMPNRGFEFGIETSFGFSNSFISAMDIFQDTIVIDLDELKDGFNFNMDFGLVPFSFQYNNKNKNWGFGMSVGTYFSGVFALSGELLTFAETENNKDSTIGGSMFLDVNLNAYFPVRKLKIKAAPSVFLPIAYVDPVISYSNYASEEGGHVFNLNYDVFMYTPFSMQSVLSDSSGGSSLNYMDVLRLYGFDISFGLEFPLGDALGLTKKNKLLDFTVGLDVYNFPIIPAKLNDYVRFSGQIGSEEPFNVFGDDDLFGSLFGGDDVEADLGPEFGRSSKSVMIYRPVKAHLWADWKPFGRILTLSPIAGISVQRANISVSDPAFEFTMEGGLKLQLDLVNIFVLSVGTGYFDNLWRNSVDIRLNFRLIEINVGVDIRASQFAESWKGAGAGVNFGLKFGW